MATVQFSCSVTSDSLRPQGLQHTRPPCPSPTPGVYSNLCPLSRWWHTTTSSSVVPFSSRLHSFPTRRSSDLAACQDSLSITNARSSLKLMSTESVMPSNHLILCRPLLLPSSIFPSIRVFSVSVFHIRWLKYSGFSFIDPITYQIAFESLLGVWHVHIHSLFNDSNSVR